MTDRELEQYVLAVDVATICYCRGRDQVRCKAHQRLLTLTKDVRKKLLTEVVSTIKGERVSGETGEKSDKAYNLALDHAIDAVRALNG